MHIICDVLFPYFSTKKQIFNISISTTLNGTSVLPFSKFFIHSNLRVYEFNAPPSLRSTEYIGPMSECKMNLMMYVRHLPNTRQPLEGEIKNGLNSCNSQLTLWR